MSGKKVKDKEVLVYLYCTDHLAGDDWKRLWKKKFDFPYKGLTKLDKRVNANLDLVQLNDDPKTPVCKLMDYGKHLFDQKKQKAASKKKTKKTQLKEIKFRPGTDENDYQIKMRNIIKFLKEGDKTKITMRFRGRELAHKEIGLNLLKRVESDLSEIAGVEQEPISEGRQLVMLLSPLKKKN